MKYPGQVDLSNRNNSQTFIVEMVGGNKRVVEVGCASGYVSQALAERGCRVLGVEIDPAAANKAKEFCEDVLVGDVESLDVEAAVGDEGADVAIFGDVLEHLHDPLAVLRRTRGWLKPDGYVVASIPNIAHGAVRLALLRGRFDYQPEGLLDETHLRFFTHDSVAKLFEEAGFLMVETRRTHLGLFETEIELRPEEFPPQMLSELESDPEATTYQFVVKAIVDNGVAGIRQLHEREETQRLEILQLRQDLRRAEEQLERATEALALEAESLREARRDAEAARGEADGLRRLLADHEEALAAWEGRWQGLERRAVVRAYRRIRRLVGLSSDGLGRG